MKANYKMRVAALASVILGALAMVLSVSATALAQDTVASARLHRRPDRRRVGPKSVGSGLGRRIAGPPIAAAWSATQGTLSVEAVSALAAQFPKDFSSADCYC